jgi:hypothetical protein
MGSNPYGYEAGIDPDDPTQDYSTGDNTGGSTPAASADGPNKWLKILQRMGSQKQQQQMAGGHGQQFNPVQTYSSLGNLGGQIAGMFLADGGRVSGPTMGLVGEAGRERIDYANGSHEIVAKPQLRMLGTRGSDVVTPLTPGPHKPTAEGKRMMSRLKPKHRFADGGVIDDGSGYDENGQPLFPTPDGPMPLTMPSSPPVFVPPPQQAPGPPMLTSPEAAPVGQMGVAPMGQQMPSAGSLGAPPPTTREQLAALKMPTPGKSNIWQKLGAAALGGAAGYVNAGGRTRPIDASAGEDAILHPGYAGQMKNYETQRANLMNQLAMEQGATTDQQAQANLAGTQIRNKASEAQLANLPTETQLSHPELIPDPDPQKLDPVNYPGLHVVLDGRTFYRPTAGEELKTKRAVNQQDWQPLPGIVAQALKVDPAMKVSPETAEKYYALYEKSQELKNPTVASLALQASGGDPEKALQKIAATSVASKVNANNARADQSWKINSGRLDKLQAPIDQLAQRTGRLMDSLNQNTPVANSLTVPELLTVMAGGMGSGLRMTQAEINTVTGGRTKWEDLKAALSKWSLDPATSQIPAAQMQQMKALVGVVNQKILQRQKLIEQAQDDLINTTDPDEHRRIVATAQKALNRIGNETQAKQQVPAAVQQVLSKGNVAPGIHKLSDGSVWIKNPDGSITAQ